MPAEILHAQNLDLVGGERGPELRLQDDRARRQARGRDRCTAANCCDGVKPARSARARRLLCHDRIGRHADHEELIEVRRSNRGELEPLEQRRRRIARLVEDALVERQPGQLAIDEQRRIGWRLDSYRRLPGAG